MDNRKQYMDEDGVLYYTQRLKAILDDLLAEKADVTALTAEETARQGADSGLQNAINTINTTKIVNISASNQIISSSEVAKIPESGVVLITNEMTGGDVNKFGAFACSFGDYRVLFSVFGDSMGINPITVGEPLDLTEMEYYNCLNDEDLNYLYEVANAYDSGDLASSSDLSDLADNTYRKNQTYTQTEVNTAIASAIAGVTQIRFEIVQSLPQTGENGVIYLVQYAQTPQGNVYQEWIWLSTTQTYETLGSTNQIDLSNYVTFDDLHALTNSEIEDIVDEVFDIEPEPEPEPVV